MEANTTKKELSPSPEELQYAGKIALEEVVQSKRNPGHRALHQFRRRIAAQATPSKDEKTNIIDQGEKVTYNLSDSQIAELFDLLEACRREGSIMHFSERQSSPARPKCGIMIDYDVVTTEETRGTSHSRAKSWRFTWALF
jgi:hypothetical protein